MVKKKSKMKNLPLSDANRYPTPPHQTLSLIILSTMWVTLAHSSYKQIFFSRRLRFHNCKRFFRDQISRSPRTWNILAKVWAWPSRSDRSTALCIGKNGCHSNACVSYRSNAAGFHLWELLHIHFPQWPLPRPSPIPTASQPCLTSRKMRKESKAKTAIARPKAAAGSSMSVVSKCNLSEKSTFRLMAELVKPFVNL